MLSLNADDLMNDIFQAATVDLLMDPNTPSASIIQVGQTEMGSLNQD